MPDDRSVSWDYSNGKNQRDSFGYDPAGNLTNDLGQTFLYDTTGQQTYASGAGGSWGRSQRCATNPLVVGETTIQARRFTEQRDAINAVRADFNLPNYCVLVRYFASNRAS